MAAAVLLCWVARMDFLETWDGVVSDAFYQRERAADGRIVVVGIDQRAMDALGPLPWTRDVYAEAIRYLNQSEESRPAVIGIDVLFVGESQNPEADRALAEAAEAGGNVVAASSATFGSELKLSAEDFYVDGRSVLAWDEPYEKLLYAAGTGHINAMADADGVLRHALLSVDVQGKGEVHSFSRVIYERFCEAAGEKPNPLSGSEFFYIPFTTKSGGYYDGISVADLLEGTVDPSFFADKVVLIGPYAAGLQDEYRTSIDHAAPMYGVEIQANLIDAFRRGVYPRETGQAAQLLFLFAICAGFSFFFWDLRVGPALAAECAICVLWPAACFLLYHQGNLLLSVLYVPLFSAALFVVQVALNYIRSLQERRRITNTFGHYVDPAVMENLLAQGSEGLELGGKTYDIAVLFVDIRGFTTMSEALDPPTVVEIINQYLTLTTDCIMKNHGILDKFVGDCTMAFWNAPFPQEDAVYLACRAAMDMVERSKALGEELLLRFGRTVSFGVGVNYGPAVVGNIGAPLRMDYTAIGDTVNTAARLEANAPGGTVYISRAVADALGDRAKTTSLGGTIRLKGKAEGFEILTLDSLN